MFSWFVSFFLSLLNLKLKWATHFSHSRNQEALFWSYPPDERTLERPYFPLPLSILVGNYLIMFLFLFFLQPSFDSQENPSPIWFPGKFFFDFRENPQGTPKKLLFLAPSVFWISGSVVGVSLLLCHWI